MDPPRSDVAAIPPWKARGHAWGPLWIGGHAAGTASREPDPSDVFDDERALMALHPTDAAAPEGRQRGRPLRDAPRGAGRHFLARYAP